MSQSIGTAMDSLNAAYSSNIIPNQEYLLQGSILDSAVEVLLHRLRGLCDNVDSSPETFDDHEMCFSIRVMNTPPVLLRVRRALDHPEMPWQLRYIGQPELGDKSRPTIVRSSLDIGTSSTVVEFLTELGFHMDFEYITKGYMFRKGRMKITVTKLFKVNPGNKVGGDGSGGPPEPFSQSYLVEVSVVAHNGLDAVAEDVRAFADQLRPLVLLDKIDYKRLQHIPGINN